ncbi:MAG: hypothetical protein ABIU05_23855, partial [Nitrospirales bacterium]
RGKEQGKVPQEHSVSGGKIGGTLTRASEYEQLLIEKKILGQESFGAAGSQEFAEAGQEGGKEEENDVHAGEFRAGERYVARRGKTPWRPALEIRDLQGRQYYIGTKKWV